MPVGREDPTAQALESAAVNQRPALSVLIGCLNNAETLEQAIRSILSQSVSTLELIVVDDGSTDHTGDLVRAIQGTDTRVRYLRLPHRGISSSLNAGLQAARGDLVAFQDADDWSLPTRLEREMELLRARPQVAVVGCRMREVAVDGTELVPRTAFAAGDVNDVLLRFNPIPNSCAMVRRASALAVGGFDERFRYAMDYDLWLRLGERHVINTIDETLAVRRMTGVNVAARKERAQTAEAIRIRVEALRRRRSLAGGTGLVLPVVSLGTPLPLKRALRQARGQAP